MKLEASIELNWEGEKVTKETVEATRLSMRDVVIGTVADAVELSPWRTGNNRRSLAGEVSQMGMVATGGEGGSERMVDDKGIEGAVYSTSGYGGYLETGTTRGLPPRPYIYPAAMKHFTLANMVDGIKRNMT